MVQAISRRTDKLGGRGLIQPQGSFIGMVYIRVILGFPVPTVTPMIHQLPVHTTLNVHISLSSKRL
jgi:hypothetical protein